MPNNSFNHMLQTALYETHRAGKHRKLVTSQADGVYLKQGNQRYLSFCSNDYYGLAQYPLSQDAMPMQGASASRLISGNHPSYEPLEIALAQFKKTEAALVFGSGYLTNIGVISALVGKQDLIIMDKYSHACMIDGARLSQARLIRYRHNDMAHLESLLSRYRHHYRRCLIATETIFSMDGDAASLPVIRALASSYDSWMLTDDAHGLGLPVTASNPSDIQTGTLSKALGAYGGYVCGSALLKQYLVNYANTAIFSTALPQAVCNVALQHLELLQAEPWRIQRVMDHAGYVCDALDLPVPVSPIIPVIMGDNDAVIAAQQALKSAGILVAAIRPPTVPAGTARLRICLSAEHTRDHCNQLITAIQGLRKT